VQSRDATRERTRDVDAREPDTEDMGTSVQVAVATLVAVTPEARAALGNRDDVRMTHFPFKVGRESRLLSPMARLKSRLERRIGGAPQLNDLYLLEPPASRLHISREHFAIEQVDDGYVVVDRGSACGTIVNGRPIGADASISETDVRDGDLIVVGFASSPYVFQFQIESKS